MPFTRFEAALTKATHFPSGVIDEADSLAPSPVLLAAVEAEITLLAPVSRLKLYKSNPVFPRVRPVMRLLACDAKTMVFPVATTDDRREAPLAVAAPTAACETRVVVCEDAV